MLGRSCTIQRIHDAGNSGYGLLEVVRYHSQFDSALAGGHARGFVDLRGETR